MSSGSPVLGASFGSRVSGLLSSLSALVGARGRIAAAPASQIIWGPSGGQTNGGACRDGFGAAGGAGLERLVERQDVPGRDLNLARDRGLGGWPCRGGA